MKGTPNKVTTTIREFIAEIIDDNREQIKKDLRALEPKERLQILERLMAYVTPKVQAVDKRRIKARDVVAAPAVRNDNRGIKRRT